MFLWETDDNPEKPTERRKKGKGETIRRCRGRTKCHQGQSPSCWKLTSVHSWLQLYLECTATSTALLCHNVQYLYNEHLYNSLSYQALIQRTTSHSTWLESFLFDLVLLFSSWVFDMEELVLLEEYLMNSITQLMTRKILLMFLLMYIKRLMNPAKVMFN